MSEHVVYLIQNLDNGLIKIGLTNDLARRWYEIRRRRDHAYVRFALAVEDREKAFKLETALHQAFARKCIYGEWFDIDPHAVLGKIYMRAKLPSEWAGRLL